MHRSQVRRIQTKRTDTSKTESFTRLWSAAQSIVRRPQPPDPGESEMKTIVCVKWTGALGDDVEFTDDQRGVDPDYLDFALNEWDACATEEALRMRDAADGGEVIVVTVGGEDSEKALVRCLAMGADRAVRVASDDVTLVDPIRLGQLLAAAMQGEQADLVLCGAQSSDAAQGATG